MATFIRGRQAGIQNDLSAGILPGLFSLDDQARYGINSKVSCLAYDPVQSLLAVGTTETTFGSGQIYVFGRGRVQVTLTLPRRASIKIVQFCADKIVSVDSKNELIIWSLQQAKKINSYASPGVVTSLVTDPMLDWAFIGLQQGDVIAYDLDREKLAPLRLPCFWREKNPRARIISVVSMQLHPRDIGQLLIGYNEGAVIYSFKQNAPIKFFHYELPPGAPGGLGDSTAANEIRRPRLTQALWHPTGTFIATAHDDSSLVFWDPRDGRIVMARTLQDTNIDRPVSSPAALSGAFSLKDPYARIAWCAKQNPDDTGILVAGGAPVDVPSKGLTFLELGQTPIYATSSWQVLSDHFKGKRQYLLRTPGLDIVDFCLIPRTSPHFAGAQDPIAVIVLLSSGELVTLSFPTGHPISPTNQLHPSLTFVHPFVVSAAVTAIDRGRWLGMTEKRQQGPPILTGGVESTKALRRYEARNIVQTAHGDGTVRIFDAGHNDQLENSASLQVDIARALARYDDIDISLISMASATGELAVGTRAGEVVIYRWGRNPNFGRDEAQPSGAVPGGITNITSRTEPTLNDGLEPFVLYDMAHGSISALKVSDVGFIAVGAEGGFFSIIDLRGPAVIYSGAIKDFVKQEKRGSLFGKGHKTQGKDGDWATAIEFGVLTVEGDEYSSICCFVGTNSGHVATFKILPQAGGRYMTEVAGSTQLSDRVVSISPIVASTGQLAVATGQAVAGLREGQQVNGTLVVVTEVEVRIFKPASGKGAGKTWDESSILCSAAAVSFFELHGYALVCIFGDGTTRAYSIPGLKEIGVARLHMVDRTRLSSSIIMPSGSIFGWTGPSELAMLNVWGTGEILPKSQDKLFNPDAVIPPRPTISNIQWISGTQYVSPTDLDTLIGGPDRPPSKRMMLAAAAEERQARLDGVASPRSHASPSQEGWGDYMTRQLNERTEKLNIMGDSLDRVQEASSSWANDASSWANKQKRNIVMKGITKGLGF